MSTTKQSRKQTGLLLIIAGLLVVGLISGSTLSQSSAATPTANDQIPAYNDTFRFGTNMGYRNGNWNDSQYSDLIAALGMNSFRVFLPENYLETWGYDIALPNMQHYQANNLKNLTANLGTPSKAHSSAPGGIPDWQLDYYAPQNLYQPIWNGDGTVNQSNYWANYIYKTVSTYKPYVKIWEVWNEPDFTNSASGPESGWWNNPPGKAELPHWNDSIFSYIRMLRVSYEVIKKVDPTALVATGGLGYESFLDAVIRYSDNPTDGTVNSSYPLNGGAYFDVLSFHYYPQYHVLNLATSQWNSGNDSDSAIDNLLVTRNNFKQRLNLKGYGTTYPAKYFIITETGFGSKSDGTNAGSMDLLRNYMIKLQVMGRANDFKQVHTYMLSDQEADNSVTDVYHHMGQYYDIINLATPAQATRKAASYGLESFARTLEGATYDAAATAALNLGANIRGAAFQASNGQRLTILWARTANGAETGGLTVNLPTTNSLVVRDWQWSQTNATQTLNPTNGQVQLTLSSAPVIVIGNITGGSTAATPTPTTGATTTPNPSGTPTATPNPSGTPTATPNPSGTTTPAPPSNGGNSGTGPGSGSGAGANPTRPAPGAPPPAADDPRFRLLWERADKLLTERSNVGRGFTWGPAAFYTTREIYAEAPGGYRTVQYYDKGRMEVTHPDGDKNNPYYVTSGLLVRELTLGKMQIGDNQFVTLYPSEVQVAGDPNTGNNNAVAPTYHSFTSMAFGSGAPSAPNRTGQTIAERIDKNGQVSTVASPDARATYRSYEPRTGHNIASVFYDYGQRQGLVWNGKSFVTAPIFNPDATYVLGLPIAEPYWVRAVVGGVEKDVLVQLFERRSLTYTPSNSPEFQVEMGNIGQHYFRWRYLESLPIVPASVPLAPLDGKRNK